MLPHHLHPSPVQFHQQKGQSFVSVGRSLGGPRTISFFVILFVLCFFLGKMQKSFFDMFLVVDFILTKTSSEKQPSVDEMETLEQQVEDVLEAMATEGANIDSSRSQATKDPYFVLVLI